MRKFFTLIFGIFAIAAALLLFLRFVIGGDEDTWLCRNGVWIKHGQPAAPMPTGGCGDEEVLLVKVFFNNNNLDPEYSCNKVFPAERIIAGTPAVARAALEELLKGPTEEEKEAGFLTNINSEVKIQKLTVENGVAEVDFDDRIEFQVGGSCRVAAIRAQITETLKQFSNVKEVVISVNGRTEDVLQP